MSDRGADERVVIVGGGLAGLAAAAALAERGVPVELFEARRKFGGRASSWFDASSGEMVDFCRHVGMACCTNFADFCRRTGLADSFHRASTLHFFGPDGRQFDLRAMPGLPAPLHLLSSLLRLGYLTWGERWGVVRAMGRLARAKTEPDTQTIGGWLRAQRQSPQAVERFWAPVIVSALGESPERASLHYARKVFVDGFLRNRDAYQIDIPTLPLSELFGETLPAWLRARGAVVRSDIAVRGLRRTGAGRFELDLEDGVIREAATVVVALPWRKAADLLAGFRTEWPAIDSWRTIEGTPISGVHLWFDRPLTELPHAVLVGTLAQWLFGRNPATTNPAEAGEHYYQVVISASYDLDAMDKRQAVEQIVRELQRAFPQAAEARLLRHRIVTEREAVFSARPGIDAVRPPQSPPIAGLFLAGDWTDTGWPGTMEGAVRSGRVAAEGVLARRGDSAKLVVADLPTGTCAKLLFGL